MSSVFADKERESCSRLAAADVLGQQPRPCLAVGSRAYIYDVRDDCLGCNYLAVDAIIRWLGQR